MDLLTVLSLCSGIGAIDIGLKWTGGFCTICYVEHASYPQQVLMARMRDGSLDEAPIWDDLTTFDGKPWHGAVDCLVAGFPCQPASLAGKRQGAEDERWLWPYVFSTICEVGPRYVLLENVPGLLSLDDGRVYGSVLGDLASWLSHYGGGSVESQCLRACDYGAPHIRERVFVLAYPHHTGLPLGDGRNTQKGACPTASRSASGDGSPRLGRVLDGLTPGVDRPFPAGREKKQYPWEPPRTTRERIPSREERMMALGNTVVPQIIQSLGERILLLEHSH